MPATPDLLAEAARRRLAYIPEQVNLYPTLSGLENLDYFSRLAGHQLDRAALLERLAEAGLDGEGAQRRSQTYSKGMRQPLCLSTSPLRCRRRSRTASRHCGSGCSPLLECDPG
jgi:ABC-type multidrug transport system ATPase subunit